MVIFQTGQLLWRGAVPHFASGGLPEAASKGGRADASHIRSSHRAVPSLTWQASILYEHGCDIDSKNTGGAHPRLASECCLSPSCFVAGIAAAQKADASADATVRARVKLKLAICIMLS
jgi:hypothetical protein